MGTKAEARLRARVKELRLEIAEVKRVTREFLGLAEARYAMLAGTSRRWKALARRYRNQRRNDEGDQIRAPD